MDSLADPIRVRLLRLMERHELGVAELCDVLQMPQSTVSRHLKVLGGHGWADHRRQGTTNLYRCVVDEMKPPAKQLWRLIREQTDDWATVAQDQLRLGQILSQRQDDSQAFFAGAAGQWDKLRADLYGQGLTRQAMMALLPSQWTIADLGCGTGQITAELTVHVQRVIGVDQSAAMLKAARRRTAGLGNAELRRGDVEAIPIDDGVCDAAVLVLVLAYVRDPLRVVCEARRILRPGGKVVIVDLLRHDREAFRRQMGQKCMGFEVQQMGALLTEAGLVSPRCVSLPTELGTKSPALLLAGACCPDG